jgi:uncharacterized HAD superfamily protein
MRIAIDIDGTIADTSRGYTPTGYILAEPMKGAQEAIAKLLDEGHEVIYYTARREQDRTITVMWLKKNNFPACPLEMEKLIADVYIDDRALKFRSWFKTMQILKGELI